MTAPHNEISGNGPTISLTGGLGNQLFQLSVALANSCSGEVYLEWSLGSPRLSAELEPELLQFKLPQEIKLLPKRKVSLLQRKFGNLALRIGAVSKQTNHKLSPQNLVRFLAKLLLEVTYTGKIKTFIPRGVGFDPTIFDRSLNEGFLVGYFQSNIWAESPRAQSILKELKLINEVEWIKECQKWSVMDQPLVLHLRMGDYVGEDRIGIPRLEYYENAVREMWSKNIYKKIWIFSDDPTRAEAILSQWILNEARWMTGNQESAASTLEAMRYGKGYVLSNSTFSWWGAFLSYNPNAEVVAPDPWFKLWDEPLNLTPKHWVRRAAWEYD